MNDFLALLKNRAVWFFVMFSSLFVACEASVQISPTVVVKVTSTTSTSQPVVQPEYTPTTSKPTVEAVPTLTTVTTPTSLSAVITTDAYTPTASLLQKVIELPLNGSKLETSENGKLIAVVDAYSDVLYIYDTLERTIRWELTDTNNAGGMTGFTSLDFSPDGNFLATGGVEQDVLIWNMSSGELVYRIPDPYDTVKRVSFSPDSQLLAVSSEETYSADAAIIIYSMATGEIVDRFPSANIAVYPPSDQKEHSLETFHDFGWFLGDAVFIPDHPNLLAITINDPEAEGGEDAWGLYFWDMENQALREVLPGSFGQIIVVSPGGQLLAAVIDDNLYGWDVQNNIELFRQNIGDVGTYRMSLTDSGVLARLSWSNEVTIWNMEGELLDSLYLDKIITDIAFLSDDELLVAYLVDSDENTPPIDVWEIHE